MSDIDTLMARGAQSVAGDIVFKNKSMGRLVDGAFVPSADGLAELDIIEVDEKPARKTRVKKEEVQVEPAAPTDVDDLLSGIAE